MTKIITHSGIAHLDDFLSTCLILYKDKTVDMILRQAEVSEEDLKFYFSYYSIHTYPNYIYYLFLDFSGIFSSRLLLETSLRYT
ncbi:hypothetical protein LCGC14_0931350 [marine sediment metagenome]|uniref:Uncharacterized protein n=1 Tax=marine sediment metagenome TaxID=412755 RepID=A0A0F9NMZ9_9ZZZZ|nr:hypothetical protein [bacterium]